MKINFERFALVGAKSGYVAGFDVEICGILLRGFGLVRPEKSPGELWLSVPKLERIAINTVRLRPELRNAVGRAAVARFNAETGLSLHFKPLGEDRPTGDLAPDAGLRRVLGEAERDALDMAGI